MPRNGDIRGFFAKKPSAPPAAKAPEPSSPQSSKAPAARQSSPAVPSHAVSSQASFELPSSPATPQRQRPRALLTREAEIMGSDDDDDDDSDDSLPPLGGLIGRKDGSASYQTTTPRAKRLVTADFHRSPLTLQQQPKHKFDLKSLINHARQDDATEASARRADEVKAEAKRQDELEAKRNPAGNVDLLSDEDEEKGDRLAMAIDRTEGDDLPSQCRFFSQELPPLGVPRAAFPEAATEERPWTILRDAGMREQMIIRGLPTILVRKGNELPDKLYLWILDEVCVERDLQLLNQYLNLAEYCQDATRRLVDEVKLYSMLQKLGGPKLGGPNERFKLSPGLHNPYPGRDWSPLRYFLQLLTRMAPNLAPENATDAVQLLLRLSLDPIVGTVAGVRVEYSNAMVALVCALPASEQQWNASCRRICNSLYTGVEQASQRHTAIALLSSASPRLIELQRRLASEALLNRPGLGAQHPDVSVSMDDIRTRLAAPDFQIHPSTTDFHELNALISLLDVVLDSGAHLYQTYYLAALTSATAAGADTKTPTLPVTPPPSTSGPSTTSSTPEGGGPGAGSHTTSAAAAAVAEAVATARFDAEVDRLCVCLKVLHDKISDNSLVAKKEAKAALDGVMKRLANTVRTHPPPKSSIFDEEKKATDVNVPKQREFMKRWTAAMG